MVAILTVFQKKSNKVKIPSKKYILQHGVLLCVLLAMNNDKLDFAQIFQKNSSQKVLSRINIYKFKAKPSCGNSHNIFCDKVLVFNKLVYLCIGSDDSKGSFQIIFINILFLFLSVKNEFLPTYHWRSTYHVRQRYVRYPWRMDSHARQWYFGSFLIQPSQLPLAGQICSPPAVSLVPLANTNVVRQR